MGSSDNAGMCRKTGQLFRDVDLLGPRLAAYQGELANARARAHEEFLEAVKVGNITLANKILSRWGIR